MLDSPRSACPINLALEVFGDRWSLIILRDMIFVGRRHYRELLLRSKEGISSNVLADRLKTLVEIGILTKADDPTHKQKGVYSLTEMGIDLVPIMVALGSWGHRWLPASDELSVRITVLADGGEAICERFMDELREEQLGLPPRPREGLPVRELLNVAYDVAVAQRAALSA
jgi:DNA-binding HxlR family transcriptional regulator